MAWIKEETVTANPLWILRIILEIFRIEYVDKIRTTHSATRVTALGFLNSCRRKDADIVGSKIH